MDMVRFAKASARRLLDSFYCRQLPDKRKIGTVDNWFVLTGCLRNAIIYAGGVGKDITFELTVARQYDAQIFLFDPSPTGIQTIQSLDLPTNVRFYPIGFARHDGEVSFEPPLKSNEGSFRIGDGTVKFPCKKISTLLRERNHKSIELLKIDIEGFEYDVIEDIIDNQLNIRQIAVEFHDFYPNIGKEKTRAAIRLLKAHGYRLFHKRGHDYSFVKTDV